MTRSRAACAAIAAPDLSPVTVRRVLDAPRAQVWRAFTDEAIAASWWHPRTSPWRRSVSTHAAAAPSDVRTGTEAALAGIGLGWEQLLDNLADVDHGSTDV